MRRVVVGVVLAAVAIGAACTQVGTDPNVVVALAFDSLPYPAIVGGDTLRSEAGVAAPLRASALNTDGQPVASAAIQYILLDTGATVSNDGIVVSTNPALTSLRIVAQVGILQSRTLSLVVTPRPDSMAMTGTIDTLGYVVPDVSGNTSEPVTINVYSNSATPPVAARGWIVRYSVSHYNGSVLSPADPNAAWFVDDNGHTSGEDTTGTDGIAARRLRLNSSAVGTAAFAPVDSFVVTATAIAHGAPLAGSPIRVVIQARPR